MQINRKNILFSIIYAALVMIIFMFHFTSYSWTEYFTKPLVLLMLLFTLLRNGTNLPIGLKKGVALGLVFSIFTDLSFLLQVDVHSLFILVGFTFSSLSIFSYAYAFQFSNSNYTSMWNMKSVTLTHLLLSILMISFPIIIFLVEGASLLQYPAILYQLFLWLLITQTLKRQDLVSEKSYYIVLFGVFLFSITTIMLSLKTITASAISFSSFPVLTYFTAQFFIVFGVLYQPKK